MPEPSGSMLCDDGAAVRIRTRASTFVAVNVASGADRAGLPEPEGVRGLRLPSRHGRKAYLLGSSGGLPFRLGVEDAGSSTYAAAQRMGR